MVEIWFLPSGKRLHSYGKSRFLMGKPTTYFNGHFQVRKLLSFGRVDEVNSWCNVPTSTPDHDPFDTYVDGSILQVRTETAPFSLSNLCESIATEVSR